MSEDLIVYEALSEGDKCLSMTSALVKNIKQQWIDLGFLLKQTQDKAYYSSYGSWNDYLTDLGLDYSQARRLVGVASLVINGDITKDELSQMSMSNAFRLIPLAKKKLLTPEIVEQAKVMINRDLRETLGDKVIQNDPSESVHCYNCGAEILGCRYVRKHGQETSKTDH